MAAQSPTVQALAAVPQSHVMQSPAAAPEHPSPDPAPLHVVSHDCYMVASDNDASAILDLDAFVLDDVMMTDETEVIDDQLLMWHNHTVVDIQTDRSEKKEVDESYCVSWTWVVMWNNNRFTDNRFENR